VEEERRVAEDARQALVILEKKRISLQTELDDLHSALENVRPSVCPSSLSVLCIVIYTRCQCHVVTTRTVSYKKNPHSRSH